MIEHVKANKYVSDGRECRRADGTPASVCEEQSAVHGKPFKQRYEAQILLHNAGQAAAIKVLGLALYQAVSAQNGTRKKGRGHVQAEGSCESWDNAAHLNPTASSAYPSCHPAGG
jgi:hypothetical protein